MFITELETDPGWGEKMNQRRGKEVRVQWGWIRRPEVQKRDYYGIASCCCCRSVQGMSDPSRPQGLQHAGLPCPSPSPGVCPSSGPLNRWCHPTISFFVALFSFWLQSFPAWGSFPVSQLFESGGQSIGASASASFLPKNIQGWFPLGLTDLISLLSKGLSRVFSKFKSISSSILCLLYGPNLTSVYNHWQDHSSDYMDLGWQSDVFSF